MSDVMNSSYNLINEEYRFYVRDKKQKNDLL